jgi:methionyl-tRNA formyltransferase
MENLRIVFMGTPEFAVPSLELLLAQNKNIVGVVTAEDKPQGRGQKAGSSPVKDAAVKHGLRILQPSKLKSPEFIEELKSLRADLQIVVAFRMLPEVVWAMPPKGTFNLHASLLPQYRGAAPINWVIINGEKETGVTTFFLQHEIDTGKIIFQEREPILEADDAGSLYERLMARGAQLVLKTVQAIEAGDVPSLEQRASSGLKHAPKIFKETCSINWNQSALHVQNFVRGLSPYPSAWTPIGGRVFKVFKVALIDNDVGAAPSEIKTDQRSYVHVKCADGWISILEFQPEGKKKMKVEEFFRGNKLELSA